ncbi:hypothetical protein AYO20_02520 [Fonsecaea nubica]|uniref:Uncharacterized protein n=1 Tax=Fonsecaea nubica TaxID=856822 RepID=A0A178D7K0_9EURO|nr:hypothetical protein AYO20_02520 [Fonsecaea nubica]OAL38068.1 hypothetical protein AYO20_02520 [Fonsecaea nubica]
MGFASDCGQEIDYNLAEDDSQLAICGSKLRIRQDDTLPLGLTSITIGTATTATGTTVPFTVPYSLSRDPAGSLRGSGTTVFDQPLKSATLISSDVHDSSLAAFSSAECAFYTGGVNLSEGASACIGDVVALAPTHDDGSKVTFNEVVVCMICSYS